MAADTTSAVAGLPARALRWALVAVATFACGTALFPAVSPGAIGAAALTLGAAASMTDLPRAALGAATMAASAALGAVLGFEPLWFAAAAAGLCASWLSPWTTDLLDAGLAALTSFSSATLVGAGVASVTTGGTAVVAAAAATSAMLGMVPVALRRDHPEAPSLAELRRRLADPFRGAAVRARTLYLETSPLSPDAATRRQLHEVATWVVALQEDLQNLQTESQRIDLPRLQIRLDRAGSARAVAHAERMLAHHDALLHRTADAEELVEQCLDHLEEARLSFAMGRLHLTQTPSAAPTQLLERVRAHARSDEARMAASLEIAKIS
jgi:hypothetical protein